METTQGDVQVQEAPKATRKYVRMSNTDFVEVANKCSNVREVAEKTGMSTAGVLLKIKRLLPGKKINKSLWKPRAAKAQ